MGKGSRNRDMRTAETSGAERSNEVKLSKKELAMKKERKRKATKIGILVCIGIIIASLLAALLVNIFTRTPNLNKINVAKTEYYDIDAAMVAYAIYTNYSSYVGQYSSYLSYFGVNGLNTKKSLHEQYYSEGVTWFEYFKDRAEQQLKEYVVMASLAREKGYTLTEDDQKQIDEYLATLSANALSAGYSDVDAYTSANICKNVTTKTITRVLEIQTIAADYYNDYSDELKKNYTASDYDEFAKDHPERVKQFDYLSYTFSAEYDKDASDSVKAEALEKAKADAEKLAAITDMDAFKAELSKICEAKDAEKEQSKTAETPTTAEVDHITENTTTGQYYSDTDLGNWAVEEGRAAGDIKTIEVKSGDTVTGYTVYMLLKPVYRNEKSAVNVRHILFTKDTYETIEAAKAKAEEVYNSWKAGEATAESFAKLAEEYSTDPGSNTNGGLYSDVYEGQMVENFNDWLFEDGRSNGDSGIVETDAGIHIIYFDSFSDLKCWQSYMVNYMITADYEQYLKDNTKFEPSFDEEKIALIP